MKISLPEEFLSTIKNKHIILDTNVFIDGFNHPKEFGNLFNKLKDEQQKATLVTTEHVLIEFLKGSNTEARINEKKDFLERVIDTYLPYAKDLSDFIIDLLKLYKIDSKDLSLTDLYLGALLVKYRGHICLLTKDLTDFPTHIFNRVTYATLLEANTIRNYGVYNFDPSTK